MKFWPKILFLSIKLIVEKNLTFSLMNIYSRHYLSLIKCNLQIDKQVLQAKKLLCKTEKITLLVDYLININYLINVFFNTSFKSLII